MPEMRKGSIFMLPSCAVVAKPAARARLGIGWSASRQGIRSVRVQFPSTAPHFHSSPDLDYMTRGSFNISRFPAVFLIASAVRSESFILRTL